MNWYKELKLANRRSYIPRKFLKELKNRYGIIVERYIHSGGVILLNPNNGKKTTFHIQHKGKDMKPGMIQGILNDLGIDSQDFHGISKSMNIEQEIEQKEQNIPEWQKQPWYIEHQKHKEPELINNYELV